MGSIVLHSWVNDIEPVGFLDALLRDKIYIEQNGEFRTILDFGNVG